MSRSAVIVLVIWVVALAGAINDGLHPSGQRVEELMVYERMGIVLVAMPVVFFSAMSFWIKGYPFDVPVLHKWVNQKFGDRTFETFIRQLKPLLFFSTMAFVGSVLGLIQSYKSNAEAGAFFFHGFVLSMAVSFLIMRTILAWRGLSLE